MKTLRQTMTENIKREGWLDYLFRRETPKEADPEAYEKWLNTLDDEDFLSAYNRVQEAERGLD